MTDSPAEIVAELHDYAKFHEGCGRSESASVCTRAAALLSSQAERVRVLTEALVQIRDTPEMTWPSMKAIAGRALAPKGEL